MQQAAAPNIVYAAPSGANPAVLARTLAAMQSLTHVQTQLEMCCRPHSSNRHALGSRTKLTHRQPAYSDEMTSSLSCSTSMRRQSRAASACSSASRTCSGWRQLMWTLPQPWVRLGNQEAEAMLRVHRTSSSWYSIESLSSLRCGHHDRKAGKLTWQHGCFRMPGNEVSQPCIVC